MRLRVGGRRFRGRAVDLRSRDVGVGEAVDALGLGPDDPLATATVDPPPLVRALAAAARERGRESAVDDEIREIEAGIDRVDGEIGELGDVTAALTAARERAATVGEDVERLRERAATLRGRLRAATEREGTAAPDGSVPAGRSREAFESATRALTEAETERVAAAQALARADQRARAARDARERRLRLRDALDNRRREARSRLAESAYPAFAGALEAVPGDAEAGSGPSAFAGDPVAGHLAAVRLAARAERGTPVVVAVRRFGGPAEAATRLRAPVVLVAPE